MPWNDGVTAGTLHLRDVPADGFWSVTVYNSTGYMEKNPYDAYSINNVTATPEADGSYILHFGGDPGARNYLYVMPGWNTAVRLYRPRPEVLDGTWKVPALQKVA